jgi:hypothetical protein
MRERKGRRWPPWVLGFTEAPENPRAHGGVVAGDGCRVQDDSEEGAEKERHGEGEGGVGGGRGRQHGHVLTFFNFILALIPPTYVGNILVLTQSYSYDDSMEYPILIKFSRTEFRHSPFVSVVSWYV